MRKGFTAALRASAKAPQRGPAYPTRDPTWTADVLAPRREETVRTDHSKWRALRETGFLLLESVFSANEVEVLLREANSAAEDSRERDETIFEPQTGAVRSVFAPHLMEPFDRVARDARILGAVQEIFQCDAYVHQSRINFQRAFVGTGFGWHSDFETWHVEDGMPAMHALSAVVFLKDNCAYNGALNVIPRSHRHFVGCVGSTPEKDAWRTSLKDPLYFGTPSHRTLREMALKYGIESCTGSAGSVLLFDCNLLHVSSNNLSPFDRCNLFFAFNACSNAIGDPYPNGGAGRPEFLATRDPKYLGVPLRVRQ